MMGKELLYWGEFLLGIQKIVENGQLFFGKIKLDELDCFTEFDHCSAVRTNEFRD